MLFFGIQLTSSHQMNLLSFSGLFKVTSKGLPNLSKLPLSIKLSNQFFIFSAVFQFFILAIFLLHFTLSIFRVIKRIKNDRFKQAVYPWQKEIKNNRKKKLQHEIEQTSKQDVYQFDEDDQQFQERSNKVMNQNEGIGNQINEFDNYHHEDEKQFIKLDQKIVQFQPFLISFLICNNIFAIDFITLSLLLLSIVSYLLFNIKGIFSNIHPLQYLFMLFSLLSYFSFYYNDHDPTT